MAQGTATGRWDSERGSIPLAILAAIIIGGVVLTLVAATLSAQESTQFEADFTEVFHVADAGVHDALVRLNDGVLEDGDSGDGELDGADRSYQYTVKDLTEEDGPETWEITSQSTVRDVQRTVVTTTREVPLFGHALFARDGVGFNGANSADSYNRDADEWCTGNGVVATDGHARFNGLAPAGGCHDAYRDITVDAVELHDCGGLDDEACAADILDGEQRCEHSGGDNCESVDTELDPGVFGPLSSFEDPWTLTPDDELEQIVDERAICANVGWNDESGMSTVSTASGGNWETGDEDVLRPTSATGRDFYCLESLTFSGDTEVERGTDGEAVRIHVKGGDIVVRGSKTKINCPGCAHNNYQATLPDASALQIISPGASSFQLADPQMSVAAAVYAPNANCPGSAGGDFFGALVCGKADNVGNWNFHYDDGLDEMGGSGVHAVASYREE